MTHDELVVAIATCKQCRLWQYRTVAVPGEGPRTPRIALLAEAPGKEEDLVGRPMMGQAGQILDLVLKQVGLSRSEAFLTNTVRCRPPRNRLADFPEAPAACQKWTQAELDLYAPPVVVLLGLSAARPVFGPTAKMGEIHGLLRQTGPEFVLGERLWTPTWHPAAALHSPDRRAQIIADMVADIKRVLR